MRFSKILILKKRIKIELAILCCIVLLLLLLSSYFLFLFLNLRIGEIVLKKDDTGVRIGRVEGISVLKFKYLIRWEDRTISEEFSYNLKREDEIDEELLLLLEKENYSRFIYPDTTESGELRVLLADIDEKDQENLGIDEFTEVPYMGVGYNVTLKMREACNPLFECGNWSECESRYGVYELVTQTIISGYKYRYCKDRASCLSGFVEARKCSMKVPVSVKKTIWCNEEYLEIYENNTLVSRVESIGNQTEFDIRFIVEGKGYCWYCHDNIKDYDEEGIDCGGSCSQCI